MLKARQCPALFWNDNGWIHLKTYDMEQTGFCPGQKGVMTSLGHMTPGQENWKKKQWNVLEASGKSAMYFRSTLLLGSAHPYTNTNLFQTMCRTYTCMSIFQASDCLQCIKDLAVWTGIANMSKLECSLSLQNIPVDPENKCLGITFKALKNGGASVSLFVSDIAIIYWYGGWSGKTDISSSEFFYK